MVSEGIEEKDFEAIHLMMVRKKMEDIILMVLNEQYIGDDNELVPRMITDALLLATTEPPPSGDDSHKGCWGNAH